MHPASVGRTPQKHRSHGGSARDRDSSASLRNRIKEQIKRREEIYQSSSDSSITNSPASLKKRIKDEIRRREEIYQGSSDAGITASPARHNFESDAIDHVMAVISDSVWQGKEGETYKITERQAHGKWNIVRRIRGKPQNFTVVYDEHSSSIWWGSWTYFFDPLELGPTPTSIRWYGANDLNKSKPKFVWTVIRTESKSTDAATKEPKAMAASPTKETKARRVSFADEQEDWQESFSSEPPNMRCADVQVDIQSEVDQKFAQDSLLWDDSVASELPGRWRHWQSSNRPTFTDEPSTSWPSSSHSLELAENANKGVRWVKAESQTNKIAISVAAALAHDVAQTNIVDVRATSIASRFSTSPSRSASGMKPPVKAKPPIPSFLPAAAPPEPEPEAPSDGIAYAPEAGPFEFPPGLAVPPGLEGDQYFPPLPLQAPNEAQTWSATLQPYEGVYGGVDDDLQARFQAIADFNDAAIDADRSDAAAHAAAFAYDGDANMQTSVVTRQARGLPIQDPRDPSSNVYAGIVLQF